MYERTSAHNMVKLILLLVVAIALTAVAVSFAFHYAQAADSPPGHTPIVVCHKPNKPSAHFITVDDNAVPAHLAHGDWVWDGISIATCGDETIFPPTQVVETSTPLPGVTVTPVVTITPTMTATSVATIEFTPTATLTPLPLPTIEPEPLDHALFLPLIEFWCSWWPFCSVP